MSGGRKRSNRADRVGRFRRDPRNRLRGLFVDTAPLRRSPAFARLWIGNSVAQIGAQLTVVAVGLHIYELTRSTFAVSLVALWAIGPMIAAGLIGGALVDRSDRRRVALVAAVIAWTSIAMMTLIAFLNVAYTLPYYALAAVSAASATVIGTARGAIVPRLLPPQLLPAAAALSGITMALAVTVGPAVAGVLVASVGYAWTYLVDAVLFSAAFLGILRLPPILPDTVHRVPVFAAIGQSLVFLRRAPNVRATFVLDIIAMTLGSPRVVFPAAGALVFGGGAVTVGYLTSAFAVGALCSGLFSGPLGKVRRQGRAVVHSIASFGICIALFGVVLLLQETVSGPGEVDAVAIPALIAAGIALAGAGASDNVSAVFRTTILQAAAPDNVRGRMQGLFTVVVTGGPRIGDLVAGALATMIALWAPAMIGGVLITLCMFVLLRTARSFMRYDAVHPSP